MPDGTLKSGLRETMEYMLDYFAPADDEQGEINHHKHITARLKETNTDVTRQRFHH